MRKFSTHGDGSFEMADFKAIGENVILEKGVLVFHPETIEIGDNVYVGHGTMLKGYPGGSITISSNTWIGQQCFFHGAGGLTIGSGIGIGPGVRIITSDHEEDGTGGPVLAMPLVFRPVVLENHCHIGMSATILPGVTVGKLARVAAGAVVTTNVPDGATVAGVPAKTISQKG